MANTSYRTRSQTKSKAKTNAADNQLPEKPYVGFPLTPHRGTGRWCKKINGRIIYFGSFQAGWKAALRRYEEEIADLRDGRIPAARSASGITLAELVNKWLHRKRQLVEAGELSLRSWDDYHGTGKRLVRVFGRDRPVNDLKPTDFECLRADLEKTLGKVRLGNEITRVRMIFKYAFAMEHIEKPIRYGDFKRPDKKTLRKEKKAKGPRMFEAEEIRRILDAADPCMRAMVLLAANGGFGNHDVATLPLSAINFETGWLDFARPKTAIDRKVPLWPETIDAIKTWLAIRPEPKRAEDAGLVFLTSQRFAWFRSGRFVDDDGDRTAKGFSSPVSVVFRRLLDRLGINGHRGFYAIRHSFESVAGDTGDQIAVDAVMGHSDPSMGAVYRERIDPERLRRVVMHVHDWLFMTDATTVE